MSDFPPPPPIQASTKFFSFFPGRYVVLPENGQKPPSASPRPYAPPFLSAGSFFPICRRVPFRGSCARRPPPQENRFNRGPDGSSSGRRRPVSSFFLKTCCLLFPRPPGPRALISSKNMGGGLYAILPIIFFFPRRRPCPSGPLISFWSSQRSSRRFNTKSCVISTFPHLRAGRGLR